jgi:hypothetical protein
LERFIKRFSRKAYRCLDCGWRGIVAAPKGGALNARNRRSPRKIPWLLIVIVSLLLALLLIFYLTREPGPASQSSAEFWVIKNSIEHRAWSMERKGSMEKSSVEFLVLS